MHEPLPFLTFARNARIILERPFCVKATGRPLARPTRKATGRPCQALAVQNLLRSALQRSFLGTNYDPKTDRIFVHRLKGSNLAEHHLVRDKARALRAWLKVRGSYPGPIFLSKQKRPIDRTTLHLLMKK